MESLTLEQEYQVVAMIAKESLERLGLIPTKDRITNMAKKIQEFEEEDLKRAFHHEPR